MARSALPVMVAVGMGETVGVGASDRAGWRRWPGTGAAHAWDRFDGMWAALFYVTLGVPVAGVLADAGAGAANRLLVVAAAVAVAAGRELAVHRVARELSGRSVARTEQGSRRHLRVGLAWAAVTLAGMVVMVLADPRAFFALYGLFPQAFVVLPRSWAIGFAATLVPALLLAEEGTSGIDGDFVASTVGSALVALALGVFIHGISRESEQRHDAIVALESARAESDALLAASLAVSRARSPSDVVAAVGRCLEGQGIEEVALRSGAEPATVVARWSPSGRAGPAAGEVTTLALPGDEGTLALATTEESSLVEPSARRMLETLAISCGLALANLRLVEAARLSGAAEERGRLAREIHDTLAQGFVSVLTQLEAVDAAGPAISDEMAARLARARSIARSSLGEARRSVAALRPVALDGAALPEAVERVVRRWSEHTGVAASVAVTGSPVPLEAPTEVTLLRAVQEALANVACHAGAGTVVVTLSFVGDAVVLDVADDGRGFDAGTLAGSHEVNRSGGGFGLEALRQRAVAVGGGVGLETAPGVGTTVTVRIPLPAAGSEPW